jgi:hypothetical protein
MAGRFVILGVSLEDLGGKWVAFFEMEGLALLGKISMYF